MDWFENLTGFRESGYDVTPSRFEVVGARLYSKVNGQSYAIGDLETPIVFIGLSLILRDINPILRR